MTTQYPDIETDLARIKSTGGMVVLAYDGGAVSYTYRNEHGGRTSASGFNGDRSSYIVRRAIESGVLVVDHTTAESWGKVYDVVVKGPMVAECGESADAAPYNLFSRAPLAYWLDLRRAIGCTIHNAPMPALPASAVDVSTVSEYGLTQKLSNPIRCF